MRFATVALLLLLVGCGKHKDTTERGTKGRSSAIISGNVVEAGVAATVTPKPPKPTRDPSLLENGQITLTWVGAITETSGKAPTAGTSCTLTFPIQISDDGQWIHHMTVVCGTQTLYDESDALNGTSQNANSSLDENPVAGKSLVFQYALKWNDVGSRAGPRSQLSVSTKDNELIVFRETAPSFKVKIKVPRWTAARTGNPLFMNQVPQFTDVVKSKASLTSSTGALPFTGKTCELRFSPGAATHNCRVQLECSGKIVFGVDNSGFEDCTLQGGVPVAMSDKQPTSVDADPELTVDMNAKTAVLSDEVNGKTTYTASFTLQ